MEKQDDEIYCPECEKIIKKDFTICPYCRTEIKKEDTIKIDSAKPEEAPSTPKFHSDDYFDYVHRNDPKWIKMKDRPNYVKVGDRKIDQKTKIKEKKIKETKCICNACGHTWFYGKQDVLESTGAAMENLGKNLSCLSGCLPAVFIPDKKVIDLNKCPNCGSRAINKEEVIHEV
jgi:hypothetical protein